MNRRRFWIIVSLAPAYVVALVVVSTILMALLLSDDGLVDRLETAIDQLGDGQWWAYMLPIGAGFALTQAVFLIPVANRRPSRGGSPRSLLMSFALGGVVAALLTLGLGLAVAELLAEFGQLGGRGRWPESGDMLDEAWTIAAIPVVLLGSWILWTGLILLLARQVWADETVGRLVRILFAGTVIELVLAVPIDVMVRRRTDCYCATGTFFSLVIGGTALLWLTGPGIVLALTVRRRRLQKRAYCPKCGYSRGGTPGDRCPECGAEWGRKT